MPPAYRLTWRARARSSSSPALSVVCVDVDVPVPCAGAEPGLAAAAGAALGTGIATDVAGSSGPSQPQPRHNRGSCAARRDQQAAPNRVANRLRATLCAAMAPRSSAFHVRGGSTACQTGRRRRAAPCRLIASSCRVGPRSIWRPASRLDTSQRASGNPVTGDGRAMLPTSIRVSKSTM